MTRAPATTVAPPATSAAAAATAAATKQQALIRRYQHADQARVGYICKNVCECKKVAKKWLWRHALGGGGDIEPRLTTCLVRTSHGLLLPALQTMAPTTCRASSSSTLRTRALRCSWRSCRSMTSRQALVRPQRQHCSCTQVPSASPGSHATPILCRSVRPQPWRLSVLVRPACGRGGARPGRGAAAAGAHLPAGRRRCWRGDADELHHS